MTIQLADYAIHLGDCNTPLATFFKKKSHSQYFIIVDENTRRACLPIFLEKIPFLKRAKVLEIKSGEAHKTLETCQFLWTQLLAHQADRNALVINLGGGVIGDMGGFVAATYKRGIDFVQVPTTLLSQVDASVGGKLGIDFQGVKNIIGVFKNPKAVIIDPIFLNSLPTRQVLNGFAEVIKHALIADPDYLNDLLQLPLPHPNSSETADIASIDWAAIIHRSVQIKKAVVEADPFEKGWRKILNFGHTIGHAIESYSLAHDTDPLLHGEAIAIGMVCELYLSVEKNNFSKKSLGQIESWIRHLYTPYTVPASSFKKLIPFLQNDKKNEGKRLNFTLLEAVGQPLYDQVVEVEDVLEVVEKWNGRS